MPDLSQIKKKGFGGLGGGGYVKYLHQFTLCILIYTLEIKHRTKTT